MFNEIMVSVPFRGYLFFNLKSFEEIEAPEIAQVSVPYRGYSFFNSVNKIKKGGKYYDSFRPLQGLFVF